MNVPMIFWSFTKIYYTLWAVRFVMLAILCGGVWVYSWWGMPPLVVGSARSFVVGYFTPNINILTLFDPKNAGKFTLPNIKPKGIV